MRTLRFLTLVLALSLALPVFAVPAFAGSGKAIIPPTTTFYANANLAHQLITTYSNISDNTIVNGHPNGATHGRVNGATKRCVSRGLNSFFLGSGYWAGGLLVSDTLGTMSRCKRHDSPFHYPLPFLPPVSGV